MSEFIQVQPHNSAHNPAKEPSAQPTEKQKTPRRGRFRSVTFLVGLAVLGAIGSRIMQGNWKVEQIRVFGNSFTPTSDIIKAAAIGPNFNPDSTTLVHISRRVEALPYVKWARLEPNPPASLDIVVEERQPIGLLLAKSAPVLIDAEGIKMPLIQSNIPDVPVLYGFSSSLTDTLSGPVFDEIAAFLSAVSKEPLILAALSEIAWSEEEGIVAITQRNNVRVLLGTGRYPDKIEQIKAFWSEVVRTESLERFVWLDFRYEGQVVAKKV